MRWNRNVALACMAGLVVAGCGSQKPSDPAGQGTVKGVPGTTFVVNVSKPVGGTIVSNVGGIPDGKINCGTGGNLCGPAEYAWASVVTLTHSENTGFSFHTWLADCSGQGACELKTLDQQADKWVSAAFRSSSTYPFSVLIQAPPPVLDSNGAVVKAIGGTVTVNIPGEATGHTCLVTDVICTYQVPVAWPHLEVTATAAATGSVSKFTGWTGGPACSGLGTCTAEPSTVWIVFANFDYLP
jgi:hypothetical protein